MLDITTIQTFAVAPTVMALQAMNQNLKNDNKNLQIALIIIVVTVVAYTIYKNYNKKQNNESK
jgi:predicted negative regulator of RcsB-dependent stress response